MMKKLDISGRKKNSLKKMFFRDAPKKYINSDGKAGFYVENKDGIIIDTEGNMTYRKIYT